MNRRAFVATLGAAGASMATRPTLFAADSDRPLSLGVIGCGWYGMRNAGVFQRNTPVEIVALCDVNKNALAEAVRSVAASQKSAPAAYHDYRTMLAARPLDAVIIGTPDHWHALPAIAAMRAGADLYLEKPIGVDVMEGEALVAAARKYGRVVQVNTQRRSTPHLLAAREKFLRSGRMGAIGLVESYSYFTGRIAEQIPDAAPPAHLDYDFWTGPAPLTPFKSIKESKTWRNFMIYGNGQIGDVGVHMFDAVRWLLDLGWPETIRSTGGIYVDRTSSADITDTQRSTFLYPNLEVTWNHRTWGVPPMPVRNWTDLWGMRFIGKNGTLLITLGGYEFTPFDGPPEAFTLYAKDGNPANADWGANLDATADAEDHHCRDFLRARLARTRPVADVGEGHISTACCQLANLALSLGRPLRYDPSTRSVIGDEEATHRLARPYRAPWMHPHPDNV